MNFLIKTITFIVMFSVIFWNAINYSSAEENTNTGETEEVKTLVLNWVEVVWKNIVELKFAKEILDNDEKDIIVRLLWDSPKEIFVLDFNIESNSVKLVLEEDLESNKDYEVVIFSITGKDWSTITSGLDWAFQFNSWDLSIYDKKVEEKVELNSASPEKTSTWELKQNENLAWKDIKKEVVEKNIENMAANKKELAKTWPEHVLLAILALILSGLIWYTINQRKNNKI